MGGGIGLRPPHQLRRHVKYTPSILPLAVLACLIVLVVVSGCDTSITGDRFENQPPRTELSVRDSSLVGNISEDDRLSSTVYVSWAGTDPDGYVVSFDLRYYPDNEKPAADEGWTNTTRNDTLILLPIPRGSSVANVVFEVRAIDNEGLRDPNPARTVFPIKNSPPTLRFLQAELPAGVTFPVASFGWQANDPEGEETIERIEISLNDSLEFISLPGETRFITVVADLTSEAFDGTVEAHVFTGRSFQSTGLRLSGMRLDDDNVFYARSVDQTDTTSTLQRHEWFVRKPAGEVLFVNDFRRPAAGRIQDFHLDLLRDYTGRSSIDVWDLSEPYATGSTVVPIRSSNLPTLADPTLRETLSLFQYIYWVTSSSTNSAQGNNLPFAASVMDTFFNRGGKLMVHSPATRPQNPEDNLGNPAVLLLPLTDLVVVPDSVRRLELPRNAPIEPVGPLPGLSEPLPELMSNVSLISELPYVAEGSNIIPLYDGAFRYLSQQNTRGEWPSPRTVASMSADRRIALFSLPLINENTGVPVVVGADGNPETAREAVFMILESLGFPQ